MPFYCAAKPFDHAEGLASSVAWYVLMCHMLVVSLRYHRGISWYHRGISISCYQHVVLTHSVASLPLHPHAPVPCPQSSQLSTYDLPIYKASVVQPWAGDVTTEARLPAPMCRPTTAFVTAGRATFGVAFSLVLSSNPSRINSTDSNVSCMRCCGVRGLG